MSPPYSLFPNRCSLFPIPNPLCPMCVPCSASEVSAPHLNLSQSALRKKPSPSSSYHQLRYIPYIIYTRTTTASSSVCIAIHITPSSLNIRGASLQLLLQPDPQPPFSVVPIRHPVPNDGVLLEGEGALCIGFSFEALLVSVPFIFTRQFRSVQVNLHRRPADFTPLACRLVLLH
jgi:hypothetical protein